MIFSETFGSSVSVRCYGRAASPSRGSAPARTRFLCCQNRERSGRRPRVREDLERWTDRSRRHWNNGRSMPRRLKWSESSGRIAEMNALSPRKLWRALMCRWTGQAAGTSAMRIPEVRMLPYHHAVFFGINRAAALSAMRNHRQLGDRSWGRNDESAIS